MQQKKNFQPKNRLDFLFDKFVETLRNMLFGHRLARSIVCEAPINERGTLPKNTFIVDFLL
jgi:hypothetical protein